MQPTTLTFHTGYQIGEVDPRIFGGFLEHMGRAVYQGVYDPASLHTDGEGFRTDVLEALGRLGMTVMRYPGGNFVSGYHWQDGVGPRENRPTVRELAWRTIEPNQFGTDEFISLSRKMGWTPMLAVNLGTGSPEEARNWVEYCNGEVGTKYADLRAANGGLEPHGAFSRDQHVAIGPGAARNGLGPSDLRLGRPLGDLGPVADCLGLRDGRGHLRFLFLRSVRQVQSAPR